MSLRIIAMTLFLLNIQAYARVFWGSVVLSEPDTVLPKVYPAADGNASGRCVVVWSDCRDGGWPKEDRWFSRYKGKIDKDGNALASNSRLVPPGWIVEESEWDTDVLFFDDDSYWVLQRNKGYCTVYFWNAEDELEDTLRLLGVSEQRSWAKQGDGKAVLADVSSGGDSVNIRLWFLTEGGLDTTIILPLNGISPQIDVAENGDIVVTYKRVENEESPEAGEVYWTVCDANGDIITEPVLVDSGFVGGITWGLQDKIMVTWVSEQGWFGYPRARLYDRGGNPSTNIHELADEPCSYGPAVASSSAGYLAVWLRCDELWNTQAIDGMLFNTSGERAGSSFQINEYGAEFSKYKWCWVHGAEARYTAMWIQDNHIYGRQIFPTWAGDPYLIDEDFLGSLSGWSEVRLAPDGSGFLVWAPHNAAKFSNGVRLRHFSENGLSGESWYREVFSGPSLATTPDGGAWLSYIKEDEGNNKNICLQRFDNQGKPLGDEIPIVLGDWPHRSSNTAVAVAPNGNGVVLWLDENHEGAWGQLMSNNGTLLGVPFRVMENFNSRHYLEVSYFEDGGFVVTFQGDDDFRIHTCFFSSSGEPQGECFCADTIHDCNDGYSMATNGRDRFVVVWMLRNLDGFAAQVFDREGNRIGDPVVEKCSVSTDLWLRNAFHFAPAVAMDTSGKWVVTWTEKDVSGQMLIYGQMYDRDGNRVSARFSVPDTFPGYERFQGTNSLAAAGDKLLYTWYGSANHHGVEVYGMLTDWEIPSEVDEQFPQSQCGWEMVSSIGSRIILRYANCPEGCRIVIFDACGRKVDEMQAPDADGTVVWGENQAAGVYFVRMVTPGFQDVKKTVLLR